MRIGTFNTRGSKTKLDAIVREILLRKLDVCLLQEFRRLTDAQLQDFTNKTGIHLHINIGSLGERKGIGIAIAYATPGDITPNLNDIEIERCEVRIRLPVAACRFRIPGSDSEFQDPIRKTGLY